MTDLASNPIYIRMTQGLKTPSTGICVLIGVSIAVTGNALWVWDVVVLQVTSATTIIELIVALVALGLLPLCLCIGMILTAQATGRHITNDDFALIRISGGLLDGEIVEAYVEATRQRFRLWISIGLGTQACLIGMVALITRGLPLPAVLVCGAPTLVVMTVLMRSCYDELWPLFLTVGTWAALRDPKNALALAGGLAVIPITYLCLIATCIAVVSISLPKLWFIILAAHAVFVVVMPYLLRPVVFGRCVRLVSEQAVA